MATKIWNTGHDENGKYAGGIDGDQTGTESYIRDWYNRPWNICFIYPDAKARALAVELAKEAAANKNIGYNQLKRKTFFTQLKKANWRPSAINTPCSTDCSASVTAIWIAVGYLLNIAALKKLDPNTTTYVMTENYKKAGFEVSSDYNHLISGDYVGAGYVLCNTNHHTCLVVSDGSKYKVPKETPAKTIYAKVTTNGSNLNCRVKPSILGKIVGSFKNGRKLTVLEKTNKNWYKVKGIGTTNKSISGYVSTKWIKML